ncbi:MAG TPA: hypothetical protein VN943_11410 [Candidatus Acidoferrum sp.]|nr:hypothetical protein [Candidatus Acidoferrum sp.]
MLWVVVIVLAVTFFYFASSLCIMLLLASFLAILLTAIPHCFLFSNLLAETPRPVPHWPTGQAKVARGSPFLRDRFRAEYDSNESVSFIRVVFGFLSS